MSLATRCPHCNTIFKVVQDQLKVSEGWVRCGRCQEVFNALEGLFDMEREPPPQRVAVPAAASVSPEPAMAMPSEATVAEPPAPDGSFALTPDSGVDGGILDRPVADTDAAPPGGRDHTAFTPPSTDTSAYLPQVAGTAPFAHDESRTPAAFGSAIPVSSFESIARQPAEPAVPSQTPSDWPSSAGDILPQEELQAPPAVQGESTTSHSTLVGDAIELMDAPQGAVTHFELELPPTAEAMAAAVSNLMQPPFQAAEQSLPVTDEADALDSRYLLPSDDRHERRGGLKRRSRGPEFADAQFPTDAMADALGWDESWLQPGDEVEPPARTPADLSAAAHHQEPSLGLLDDNPPAGAQLLSRQEPADAQADAPAEAMPSPVDAGPTTLPSRFHEDYQPEQSLPPPSKRKGRPGTRGRSPQSGDEPEFIKQAERKAIWRHPAIRGVLALLALLLAALLAGQVAHHERDLLASRYPELSPWLHRWCEVAGCTVRAPMQLDDLQVDNIALVRTSSQGEDTYRLTAIIRNRAPMALAWPHLDLSLTDANGAVVVRRVFAVSSAVAKAAATAGTTADEATTGVPSDVPANSSTTLQWQLRAPDLQLAGYTAELFYP